MNNTITRLSLSEMTEISYFPGHDDFVELSNPLSRKRVKINKESLMKLILQLENDQNIDGTAKEKLAEFGFICDSHSDTINKEDIKLWEQNNWEMSLYYYLWSRQTEFVDSGENYDEIRKQVLEEYVEKEGLPKKKNLERNRKTIKLPQFTDKKSYSKLGEVLLRRTTVQDFKDKPMDLNLFNEVIFYAFKELRGELKLINYEENILDLLTGLGYPFEIYLLIFNVTDLEPGLYKYNVENHSLILMKKGKFRDELQKILIGQPAALTSSFAVLLSVDYEEKQWRYRHERELRNTYIVAAQICQQLILSATDSKVFCNLTPASLDDLASELLNLNDQNEQLLYTVNIGMK